MPTFSHTPVALKQAERSMSCAALDDLDLLVGQAVEVIDEAVNFAVGGGGVGRVNTLVQLQHLFDQRSNPAVPEYASYATPSASGLTLPSRQCFL